MGSSKKVKSKHFILTVLIVAPRTMTMMGAMVLLSNNFFSYLGIHSIFLITSTAILFALAVFWVYGLTRWQSTWKLLGTEKKYITAPKTKLKYVLYFIVMGSGLFVALNGYISINTLFSLMHINNLIAVYIVGSLCLISILAITWTYVLQHTKKNLVDWEKRLSKKLGSKHKKALIKTVVLVSFSTINFAFFGFFITHTSLQFFPFFSFLSQGVGIAIAAIAATLYGLTLIVSKGGTLYESFIKENLTSLPPTRLKVAHIFFGIIYTLSYGVSSFSGIVNTGAVLGMPAGSWFFIVLALLLTTINVILETKFTTTFLFMKRAALQGDALEIPLLRPKKDNVEKGPSVTIDNNPPLGALASMQKDAARIMLGDTVV